jgi:hypothetical protein
MTILFSSQTPVKPSRPFGKGLLAFSPHFHVSSHTASDDAWLAADNARRARAEAYAEAFAAASRIDREAAYAEATDRLSRGVCF